MLRPKSDLLTDTDLDILKTAQCTARVVDDTGNANDSDAKAVLDSLARIERIIAGLVVLASLDMARTETRDAHLMELKTRVESIAKRFGF